MALDPATIGLIASAISSIAGYASSKKKSKVDPTLVSAGQQVLDTASQYFMNRAAQNNALDAQSKLANIQNRMQMAFWNNTFNAQNARQDYLNRNAAVIQRNALRAAGLNGASMDNGTFVTSANTGAVGGAVPSFSPIALDIGAARAVSLQNQKSAAEVELLREQTQGQKTTNKILDHEEAFKEAALQRNLDLQWSNIQLNNWKTSEIENNIKVLQATTRKIENESKNFVEQLNILKEQYAQEQIKTAYYEPQFQAQIASLLASAEVSKQQVYTLMAQEGLYTNSANNLLLEGDKLQIEVDTMEDLYKSEKLVGIAGTIAKLLILYLKK